MKSVRLKMLVITIALINTSLAFGCPPQEGGNELDLWVCNLSTEMMKRDAEADYQRDAELITSTPEIKKIRANLSNIDDGTCRNFNQTNLVTAFQRILQHQSLPRSLMKQRSEFAAAKILNESNSGKVDVCESQALETRDRDHTYQNLYYFKFGPMREQKHFLIRVTTKWRY
jgi:hypothetical protein